MFACVCISACVYVCVCLRACVYLFVVQCARVCVYACVYGRVRMLASVFLHAFMGLCVYKDIGLYSQKSNFPEFSGLMLFRTRVLTYKYEVLRSVPNFERQDFHIHFMIF